jgi:phosphatidylglycerol lysyltransferase
MAEGYSLKVYDPPIKAGFLQKLEQVSTLWLQDKGKTELTFTEGIFDPAILKNHLIMAIESADEKVYAFLDVVPCGIPGMAVYDLIRQLPDAPNGILDMLLCQAFLYFKDKGYQQVNMGLAPLSGIDGRSFAQKTIRYAYEHLRAFGHFKGLRRYKEKFSPAWEKKIPGVRRRLPAPAGAGCTEKGVGNSCLGDLRQFHFSSLPVGEQSQVHQVKKINTHKQSLPQARVTDQV